MRLGGAPADAARRLRLPWGPGRSGAGGGRGVVGGPWLCRHRRHSLLSQASNACERQHVAAQRQEHASNLRSPLLQLCDSQEVGRQVEAGDVGIWKGSLRVLVEKSDGCEE